MAVLLVLPVTFIAVAVKLNFPGLVFGKRDIQRIVAALRPPVVPDKEDDLLPLGVFVSIATYAVPQDLPLPDKLQIAFRQQDLQIPVRPLKTAVGLKHRVEARLQLLRLARIQPEKPGLAEPVVGLLQTLGPQLLLRQLLLGMGLLGEPPCIRQQADAPYIQSLLFKIPVVAVQTAAVALDLVKQRLPGSAPDSGP